MRGETDVQSTPHGHFSSCHSLINVGTFLDSPQQFLVASNQIKGIEKLPSSSYDIAHHTGTYSHAYTRTLSAGKYGE